MAGDAREQALFQERILDHYRRPRNRRALDDADRTATRRNPLCGDDVAVYLALDPSLRSGQAPRDTVIGAATFVGQGCSITQAAASLLTEALAGRTTGEADLLLARYRAMIEGSAPAADVETLGELRALSGVARYPGRRRCALLPAEAFADALRDPRDASAPNDDGSA